MVGISCVGSSVCQAVGSFSDGVNPGRTLVESWDGATWTVVPSPNVTPGETDRLSGVDCFSATTCSAVGQSIDPSTGFDPLELDWNGSTWSVVPNPSLSAGSVQTAAGAVSCVTDWECVAVGATNNGGVINPFAMTAPIARSGYRFVATDGGVFDYGAGAPFLGSMGGMPLNKPVVGMAVMPAGDGYYLVATDGGIFNFGSAKFYGSTGSIHLNMPVVGMAVTADGGGYWLVASDGGIFSYGDAQFYGSTGSMHLNKPIVGMAATPDGKGYWLVASDGGIFNYGDAAFSGSAGSLVLNKPVVGMAAPVSGGYYLVATDGGIFSYPTSGRTALLGFDGLAGAEQAHRRDDRRRRRLLPERLGRRGVRLPDHRRPALLGLDRLHPPQRADRGDRRLGPRRRPGGAVPCGPPGGARSGTGRRPERARGRPGCGLRRSGT